MLWDLSLLEMRLVFSTCVEVSQGSDYYGKGFSYEYKSAEPKGSA